MTNDKTQLRPCATCCHAISPESYVEGCALADLRSLDRYRRPMDATLNHNCKEYEPQADECPKNAQKPA